MKSKDTAYFLWFLSIFGWLGLHRLYLGKTGTGILWMLTGGLFGLGSLYDFITLGKQIDEYDADQNLTEQ